MLKIIAGDSTLPIGEGGKIIAHIVNNRRAWGKGFVLALEKRYPETKRCYMSWPKKTFILGENYYQQITPELWVCHMLAQDGLYNAYTNKQPLSYYHLENCLMKLAQFAFIHNLSVHMPKIGAGLGGGEWPIIKDMISEKLKDVDTTIYSLTPVPDYYKPPVVSKSEAEDKLPVRFERQKNMRIKCRFLSPGKIGEIKVIATLGDYQLWHKMFVPGDNSALILVRIEEIFTTRTGDENRFGNAYILDNVGPFNVVNKERLLAKMTLLFNES